MSHGKVPPSLKIFRCDDCDNKYRTHSNMTACRKCGSRARTQLR